MLMKVEWEPFLWPDYLIFMKTLLSLYERWTNRGIFGQVNTVKRYVGKQSDPGSFVIPHISLLQVKSMFFILCFHCFL